MNRIITRPFYCGRCVGQKEGFVALFGSTTQKLFCGHIEYKTKVVTPHLVAYNTEQLRNLKELTIKVMCAVNGCGLTIIYNEDESGFWVEPKNQITHIIPRQQLLNLIAYKDPDYMLTESYL